MRRVVTSHCQAVLTEVTALNHEVLDDTVELGALVPETFLEFGTILLDTRGKCAEVLSGLRDGLHIVVRACLQELHFQRKTYSTKETNSN